MGDDIKRMCKWDKKRIKKDLQAFTESVENPKFVCGKCIRVSNKKKRLCDPIALEEQTAKSDSSVG